MSLAYSSRGSQWKVFLWFCFQLLIETMSSCKYSHWLNALEWYVEIFINLTDTVLPLNVRKLNSKMTSKQRSNFALAKGKLQTERHHSKFNYFLSNCDWQCSDSYGWKNWIENVPNSSNHQRGKQWKWFDYQSEIANSQVFGFMNFSFLPQKFKNDILYCWCKCFINDFIKDKQQCWISNMVCNLTQPIKKRWYCRYWNITDSYWITEYSCKPSVGNLRQLVV